MEVTVRELMCRTPATIDSTAKIEQALERLLLNNLSELFVVDEKDHLLGVVTDYELLKAQLDGTAPRKSVDTLTSRNIAIAQPNQCASELIPLFRDGRRQRMAVVEQGRIVGQISRLDILRLLTAMHGSTESSPAHDHERSDAVLQSHGAMFARRLTQLASSR